jgi:AcrR family transcriptional regulator
MSPRTPQQFKEMREEKMTLIMDVALEHFANEGYYTTTISHIARHAKMSKGLMYNYFESKEALLKAIIHRSVNEVYRYLDPDRDGSLSEEDFKFFIRKINVLLKEKRYFWRLLMQLLAQNDVREQFLKAFPESDSLIHPGHEPGDNDYPSRILKLFTDYFFAKRGKMGKLFDPDSDFEMFFITLLGYAIKTIYSESDDKESNEKAINRIIELFK